MPTKGHWPAGKRRNPSPSWEALRLQLVELFATSYKMHVCTPGRLAADLGVDRHTVGKWLAGKHWPGARHLPKIRTWIRLRQPQP